MEMQIKTILRNDLTQTKIAIIKKCENKCWRGFKEKPLFTTGGIAH